MPKQTAIAKVNEQYLKDRENGYIREYSNTENTARQMLEEYEREQEEQRQREEEQRQRQRNAASVDETMDLVRTYGDYGLERRAAEMPQPVKEERRAGNIWQRAVSEATPTATQPENSRQNQRRAYTSPTTERTKENRRLYGVDTSRVSQKPSVVSGNIDLNNRPIYHNADGSISTVDSVSFGIDGGREVLVPTIGRDSNGNAVRWTNEEAWQHYLDTGEHLGIFNSVQDANNYAQELHRSQEKQYTNNRTVADLYKDTATMTRWRELASKDQLTAAEKQEARAARKEIKSTLGFSPSDVEGQGWKTRYSSDELPLVEELFGIDTSLNNRTNAGAGIMAGVVHALGIDWLSDRIFDLAGIRGEDGSASPMKATTTAIQKAQPGAYTVGNIAGSTGELLAISGAVGNAMKGVKWFTEAAPWIQKAISSGINFAINGLQSGITSTQTKEEWAEQERKNAALAAEFGATYTPREYNPWKQVANVGISTGVGALAGAAGGALETVFGLGTSKALIRYGLQYNTIFRAIASGINGIGFATGSTAIQEASKYLQYPEGYTASPSEIASNLAVAFLFSSVSSVISDLKAAPQNRENLLKMMDELTREYAEVEMKMAGQTGQARRETAQRVTELTARIRNSVATSRGMSGVSNEIKSLVAALDIIDDRMAPIIAGGNGLLGTGDIMAQAEQAGIIPALRLPAYNGESGGYDLAAVVQATGNNVPAPMGEAPAIPEAPAPTENFPAWYAAYQNAPRPIDQPMQQRPNIPAPAAATPPLPQQSAQGNAATPPAPPVPQNAAQSPTEGVNWDGIINEDRIPNLTAGEKKIIEQMPKASEMPAPLTPSEDRGTMEPANYTSAGRELADGLKAYDRLEKNGFEYTLNETSAGWIGRLHDIRGNKFGGMISNARALDYQTQALGSREKAIDTLVQVAERNNLLAEEAEQNNPPLPKQPEETPTISANTTDKDIAAQSGISNRLWSYTRGSKDPVHGTDLSSKTAYLGNGQALVEVPDTAESVAMQDRKYGGIGAQSRDLTGLIGKAKKVAETGEVVSVQPVALDGDFYGGQTGKNKITYVFTTPNGDHKTVGRDQIGLITAGFNGKLYYNENSNILVAVNDDGTIHGVALFKNYTLPNGWEDKSRPAKLKNISSDTTLKLPTTEEAPAEAEAPLKLPTEEAPSEAQEAEKLLTLPQEESRQPHEALAAAIRAELDAEKPITSQRLQELAEQAYGGTRGSGAYDIKTAYDAMELAVNQYLMDNAMIRDSANGDVYAAQRAVTYLEDLLSNLPTQTVRTEEQEQYQQFSTPPNIAYLAAWAANIGKSDTVLEPSAGIGGLALWPKAWGATVYGNELSPRRAEILRSLGLDEVFTENAEQINNVLPDRIKPTVVLMNPPFSSTAGRLSSNNTANAKRHIEQALDRLEDGGRLVAILGRGMANDSKTFAPWWNDLRKEYSIRANLSIDGENYKKYGTTFGVQLVVIDKTGPQTGETITGKYDDLTEIPSALEGIRNDRIANDTGNPAAVGSVRHEGMESGADTGSHPDRGEGLRIGGGETGDKDGQRVPEPPVRVGGRGNGSGSKGAVSGVSGGNGKAGVQGGASGEESGPAYGGGAGKFEFDRSDIKPETEEAENTNSVYSAYVPRKARLKGSKPHPAKLVESAAMAAVEPPDVTYTPNLPKEIVTKGVLSDAQLENVIYAGQAHSQINENGTRKGFFIGDGTGVGKGRQISGIIMDNFRQGRKKAIWISEKSALINDARRDWKALGGNEKDIISLGDKTNPKKVTAIKEPGGIMFGTYDTLKSDLNKRIKLLQDWLGKDFDGIIAFDEAHNMGNAVGEKGGWGSSGGGPSKKAIAGLELQKAFPNARVLYASATGATEASNYAYLERLGLWGPGTAFNNFNDFMTKISSGGLAAMELVARDMKAMGLYMARSISYDDVKYDTLTHDLTPVQTDIYNTMSKAWQKVLQNVERALELTGQNKNGMARGRALSAIYGTQQRFYDQIITSMSMPSVIADIRKELANGRSVVIQLTKTNAAAANRAIAKNTEAGGDLDDLDLTPSDSLIQMVEKSFPIELYEEYEDDNGNIRSRPVTDSNGNPVIDKKAVQMRDALIEDLKMMKVPDGPLEMLFDAFGEDQVAEVTGRTRRVVEKRMDDGSRKRVVESRSPNSGVADANAFQDGKKRILVFSDAGGTGRSYHADLTAKNQQQRVHYLLQPGWNASKAVQGFGRTHRSNQANAPIFRLVTTNVMGQKRFTSTIARRLDQLGALTKGQRQAGSGVFSEKDNLENPIAMDALSRYYRTLSPEILKKLGLYDKIYDSKGHFNENSEATRDIGKFLNRILSLEVDEQNEVFQGFYDMFDSFMQRAIENGTVDMGLENYRAEKIEVVDENVVKQHKSGGETKYVQLTAYQKPSIIPYEEIAYKVGLRDMVRLEDGSVRAVYEISPKTNEKTGEIQNRYRLDSPVRGQSNNYLETTLKNKTTSIPKKEWSKAWKEEIKKVPEYTTENIHLLTGTLLPIWDKLPQGNARVMRITTADGKQYLGRVIRGDQIDGVLYSLGAKRTMKQYTGKQISDAVLREGKEIAFQNDKLKLNRRRVGGEWRMELTGNNVWFIAKDNPDVISEKINFQNRYFIPTGEKGVAILNKIMESNPVMDVRKVARESVDESREVENFNGNTAPRHPENWKAERVGDKDKTPMNLTDIVNMIRHDFDIPVTTGNIRSRDARAQYRRQPQSVRSKIANSIPDIAHELGHHLDNIFGIRESLSAAAKAEVVDALPESFKAQYKDKNTWPGEGIAEFLRRYLQNSETAVMDYPVFSEEFFGRLDTKARATLDKLADEVNAYYALSEQTGNWPVHNREDKGRDYRSLGEKLQDMNTHFRTLFIDSMEPIKQFEKEAGGKAYLFATNAAYAGNRAYAAITGDLYDLRGNKLGVGLQKALEGIRLNNKQEYTDFGMYLICRHGPERLAEGMRVFSHDAWDNTAWMEQRAEELAEKYPNFEEAAERLEEYQHELIQAYGVASGLYSQETIDAWMERWEHYVPFLRWFGETEKRSKGQKQGFANQTRIHGKAVGSGLEIINPVDNIMENTVRLITASVRNEVMQEITKAAANTEGAGRWLEQVPMPLARKTWDGKGLKTKTLEEFDEYFKAKGKDLGKKGLDLIQEILDNAIDDLLVQYGRGKAHGDIVTVMKNGSPEYWKINDPDLLRSVTNMGPTRAGELLNYYGRITRFITGNITGMNIVWSVASNMPRDIGTMFTFSRTKNIAKLLAGIGDSYVNRIKGDKASDLYKEYMALGGNSTSAQTADKDMAKKARKALQKQKTDWLNPLEWVEFTSDMIESGPRYAYYKICRTQYGMTPEEAFYAAMEITVNFKRAGVLSREVNILVPFFNASIQGVDRAARWIAAEDLPADQRKAGRARRIGVYLGASLAIAALSMALNGRTKKKRDDLEKLSTYTKNNYFVVQMRNGKYLAIPKPRELAIPISLFERLMETYVMDNPHAFDDFWEYVTDNTLPGVVSGIAQGDWNSAVGDFGLWGTIHYLTSNQDFLGRPIVSSALQDLEAKDQYDPTTSKLAKLIGEVFNVSPKQLDFLGNNLFGGFWQWQKALAPVSGKADLTLGVQSKWIKDPLFSTDITNRMYDERERLKKAHNSNPEDIDLAIKYRTVSDISSFYGRYYRLAKNEEETPQSRVVREAMLDAILGVEQNANTEPARKFLLDVVDREGSTEYMPAVMDVTVKSDDGTVYALTAEEYFLHQTRYEALYYNYIRQAVDNQPKMTDEEKTSTVEAAKRIAGIVARGETVEDHGGTYKAYSKVKDLLEDGVSEGNLINYLAAADNADTDGSGKVSNAELLGAVSGLRLSGEESASLIGYSNESLGLKLRSVSDFGVDSGEYGLVLEALGNNTLSQANVTEAIDQVYGPTTKSNKEEKAALWQAMNKSWKASKNPYDPDVGERVQSGLTLPAD